MRLMQRCTDRNTRIADSTPPTVCSTASEDLFDAVLGHVLLCPNSSQVLKVVFAGRGCRCGSIDGGGMNHGLLSTPIRISHFPTNPDLRCINR